MCLFLFEIMDIAVTRRRKTFRKCCPKLLLSDNQDMEEILYRFKSNKPLPKLRKQFLETWIFQNQK